MAGGSEHWWRSYRSPIASFVDLVRLKLMPSLSGPCFKAMSMSLGLT
jgi:hypothetical protein